MMINPRPLLFLLFSFPLLAAAQWGASFHYSALPFFGVNYEFKERIRPELRVGTDTFLENLTLEPSVVYDIVNRSEYEIYSGLGFNFSSEEVAGISVPIGLNVYPFEKRNFGFHMEVSPIMGGLNAL